MKFTGGIEGIHTASADAIEWIENLSVRLWPSSYQMENELQVTNCYQTYFYSKF